MIDLRKLKRQIELRAVLTGRVVQRGEDLSVSAELVDAQDNSPRVANFLNMLLTCKLQRRRTTLW